jgi:hypothetical protein
MSTTKEAELADPASTSAPSSFRGFVQRVPGGVTVRRATELAAVEDSSQRIEEVQ